MTMLHILLLSVLVSCYGQNTNLTVRNDLTERIGNFSLELLYHTSVLQDKGQNLIIAPLTAFTVLAVIAEGATDQCYAQIKHALRLPNDIALTRESFKNITKYLLVNASTVELSIFNAIFVDENKLMERDFKEISKTVYHTLALPLTFADNEGSANKINQAISQITRGKIPSIVDSSYFREAQMLITSAVYFKGQWKSPFNKSSTTKAPFFNSFGERVGAVNMMYNRYNYPFANIKQLQARVIELPYGQENRLSMLIMLPNPGVSLEDMFKNFLKVPLDSIFSELKIARDEFGEDEVDCFIPRFKIDTSINMNDVLQQRFGVIDLFDSSKARLPYIARTPMYVTKIVHRALIEVTEEGTEAAGVTAAEFANRISIVRFEANRPFSYMIVEKITNTIVFGGLYITPVLY